MSSKSIPTDLATRLHQSCRWGFTILWLIPRARVSWLNSRLKLKPATVGLGAAGKPQLWVRLRVCAVGGNNYLSKLLHCAHARLHWKLLFSVCSQLITVGPVWVIATTVSLSFSIFGLTITSMYCRHSQRTTPPNNQGWEYRFVMSNSYFFNIECKAIFTFFKVTKRHIFFTILEYGLFITFAIE